MKLLLLFLFCFSQVSPNNWLTDFEKAKKLAQDQHKYILLNFSGSDWCGPCIQMHKQIFESENFGRFATDQLVLVNADFPRSKKHALSRDQQKKNELLADHYNRKGIFPLTILLTPDGQPVHSWEGLPETPPEAFTKEIQTLVNAGK